jgi:sec-independent protein translocase protein TatA
MDSIILFISGSEIFIILLVVLLLFGANKLPEIARGLGKGYQEFKKATNDIRSEFDEHTSDIKNEVNNLKKDITEHTDFEELDGQNKDERKTTAHPDQSPEDKETDEPENKDSDPDADRGKKKDN